MTLEQLIEAARKAIQDGDLEKAEKLTAQAKAMKALDSLAPVESEDIQMLRKEIEGLKKFKAQVEAEPAGQKAGTLIVTEDEADKKAKLQFKSLGEQLLAIRSAYIHPHMMDDRLKAQKAVLGLNEGQSSDGGFLVQQDFLVGIQEKMHASAVVSSRCDRQPVGPNANGLKINVLDETSRANGSRWGGVRGYWLAEGGTLTASQPKFNQMQWNLKKVGALMYLTDELIQDTTALSGRATVWAGKELAFMVDDAIINGVGAGTPLGILNATCLVTISKETGQAAATVVKENIFKMWARMWAPSRMSAVWLVNQDVEPALWNMDFPVGTGGIPAFLPPGGLSQSPYSTLFGKSVIPTEFNATLGTVGDIILADFGEYLLIDKGGVQGASSIHVQFLTDQEAFRWIYRVDGKPMWNAALTPYKGTATQSPYVALATRA